MGYFSNCEEGLIYEQEYCDNCVHNHAKYGCPVLNAHKLWNYDECNKPDSILHKIIPRIKIDIILKDGKIIKDYPKNGECIFFQKEGGIGTG